MRVPSSFVKGSGSLELAVNEPGRVTAQPAPSSSTGPAARTPPSTIAVLAVAVTIPATAIAATATMTTVGRIVERFDRMITWTLLQTGVGDGSGTSSPKLS